MHHNNCHSCKQSKWASPAQPIVCPPQYRVHDTFVPRIQPVIQPIVNVNREHMVNVPQYYFTETNETVAAESTRACPGSGNDFGFGGGGGYPMQSFPRLR